MGLASCYVSVHRSRVEAGLTIDYYRKRGSASYIVREVRSVRERSRDTERDRERRKWRHPSSAEIGEEFCTFSLPKCWNWRRVLHFSWPKMCTLVSPLWNGAEFTFSVAKTLHFSKQFAFFVKFAFFAIVLPLPNGVTGDRSTEKNDRISGCTVLRLIEKMNQINTKNYWK